MNTVFIEAAQGGEQPQNWGKFAVCRWTSAEWARTSCLSGVFQQSVLRGRGWTAAHIWVLDLQTGEGACFYPGGMAEADLNKHKVWVCPMFQPFLQWLYLQDLSDLSKLPGYVELTDAEFLMSGHRREGK